MSDPVIDVRLIAPQDRHSRLLGLFADLPVGGAFVLANDHDPRPLHHQFSSLFPDAFGWDYLERGPATWQVRITKTAEPRRDEGSCCGHCS
jgi:uncharacterized protein (DUF2249 family)